MKDKKTLIFSTSITKHIDQERFNAAYKNGEARFQRWPGGKVEHIKNYIKTHLEKEKPDTVMIQIGGNDLQRGDRRDPATITSIANDIIETAQICRANDVQHIFVGGVTVRKPRWTWDICKALNNSLEGQCRLRDFNFISNTDISPHDLYDGVHLNESGVSKMANNMLSSLDDYFNSN
jgi:lysophospholipase L1-like esterase